MGGWMILHPPCINIGGDAPPPNIFAFLMVDVSMCAYVYVYVTLCKTSVENMNKCHTYSTTDSL